MKKTILNFIIVIIFANYTCFYAQNKIDKSKKELTQKNTTSSNTSNSSSKSNIESQDINPFIEVIGYFFLGAFKYGIIGDYKNEDHLYNELSPYPFFKGKGNYYEPITDSIKSNFFRLDTKGAFLYSSNNLFGSYLELKLRASKYIHLQTDFYQVYEFQKIENTGDGLVLYYFNLGYDRIRTERFNLGWTLGASYVGGEIKKAGFSYGLNAEYFIKKNISLLADGKWSSINQFPVNSYAFEGKFYKKNCFLSLGFKHLKIATPTYNFISLGCGIYL